MTKFMYTVYDQKSESYSMPFFHLARGDALRAFTSAANDKEKSNIGLYPEDYDLFELGTYDERTGEFEIYEVKKHVAAAQECVTTTLEEQAA